MKTKLAFLLPTLLALLLVLGLLVGAPVSGGAQPPVNPRPLPRYVEGELLVKFRGGAHGPAADHARAVMKHEVKRHFDFIGWQHIRLPHGMTVEEGLARYRNLPDVLAVEPNGIMQANEPARSGAAFAPAGAPVPPVPNDPMFSQQYGLAKIEAPTAWAITTGSTNVVVAVIDTGINYNHEDLRDNMWRNPGEIPGNGIDDDGNGYVDDVYGIDIAGNDSDPIDEGSYLFTGSLVYHGTIPAGILGAVGNNGKGITGLNWRVQIMAIRTFSTNNAPYDWFIRGFEYMTLMKRRGVNIRASNNSYASTPGSPFSQAFKDAIDAAGSEGILNVFEVRDGGSEDHDVTPAYPACFTSPSIIAVTASDQFDNLLSYAAYGRTCVDLAAPGTRLPSTYAPGANAYISSYDGTAQPPAFVAGTAGLIAAVYPSLTVTQIKSAILDSVDVLPAFTDKTLTGGRLNAGRALYFAARPTNAPPVIVSQPRSQLVEEGDPVAFTVIASGTPPFRYRWQLNGADLPGATNSAVQWSSVGTNQAGGYSVMVSNAFGSTTSVVATLTVSIDPNPVFTRVTNGPLVTIVGPAIGAVWGDYDNDGNIDLFVPRGTGNISDLLFRNKGDGSFTNLVSNLLAMDTGDSWSGAWGDYDNDGDLDLLVANTAGQNEFLYRNDGGGNFAPTTAAQVGPIVSAGGNSYDCGWVDFDNDGWLDALISNGGLSGDENEFLFHNNGDGTFARVTNSIIANDGGQSYGMAWGDYDNDGRPDLFLANAFGQTNRLYHNDGNGAFTRITTGDLVTQPGHSTGGAWGDYDNDGDLDLYVGSTGRNLLFRNDGAGTFTRITAGDIANDVADAFSAAWGDYDNDGFLDLFVANETSPNADFLYHNNGDGTFRKITASIVTKDGRLSAGCSWVDYDNDGHLDLFVSGYSATSLLYHNNGNSNGWLKVKCVGTVANSSGIGAKVRVRANIGGTNRWQLRQISGGGGFGSQLQLLAHFGLGDATNVDLVRIEWPSGTVQELTNVSPNQFLIVTEAALGIRRQPQDQLVVVGSNVTFRVVTASEQPARYQWQFNDASLPGQTNDTLLRPNAQFADEGNYGVAVASGPYAATSRVARLIVVPFRIISQPTNLIVRAGLYATFGVSVLSLAPVSYQWRFNGTDIPGATASTLLVTNVQLAQDGSYSVRVSNAFGSVVSSNAALVALIDPRITLAPISQSVVAGGSATFSVAFTGNPQPFGVEWRQGSVTKASNTVSRLNDFHTLTNAHPTNAGTWRVIVRNLARNVQAGENRTFDLIVLADSDGDGLPDIWETSYPTAANASEDTDHDGLTNLQEYQAGTNPTNSLSYLRVESLAKPDGTSAAVLRFLAASNTTYTVQARAAVDHGPWLRVADVVAVSTNRVVEVIDSLDVSGSAERYYRLATPQRP